MNSPPHPAPPTHNDRYYRLPKYWSFLLKHHELNKKNTSFRNQLFSDTLKVLLNTGWRWNMWILILIHLLTAIGLTPGGSSTVHIYTQTVNRTTQKKYLEQHNNFGECRPCPVLVSYTLAFALQLRKKHGKTSVRVAASKVRLAASSRR